MRCLPELLDVVSKEGKTKAQIAKMEKLLVVDSIEEEKFRETVIEWMASCLSKLKSSPFAKQPLCLADLSRAEELLIKRKFDPNQKIVLDGLGFIDAAKDALIKATRAIASFGDNPLFDGWAKIETRRENPCGEVPYFPENITGEVLIGINQQWELAEQLGCGVYCWELKTAT